MFLRNNHCMACQNGILQLVRLHIPALAVLINVASVHWAKKVYVGPERFLNKVNGKLEYSRRTDFIPFGVGDGDTLTG